MNREISGSPSSVRAIGGFLLIVAASLAFAQPSMDKKHSNMPGMASGGDIHSAMKTMMKNMEGMKMSGDTDKDFAMMMKMHHQQALEMAQLELDQGKSPEMKAMAEKIIAAPEEGNRRVRPMDEKASVTEPRVA